MGRLLRSILRDYISDIAGRIYIGTLGRYFIEGGFYYRDYEIDRAQAASYFGGDLFGSAIFGVGYGLTNALLEDAPTGTI